MSLYPPPLDARFATELKDMRSRIATLEARTAGLDSGWPVAAIPAVIDPGYTSGDPHAYLNGSTTLTGPYQHLASYTPAASDQVLAVPVGVLASYVIIGKLA